MKSSLHRRLAVLAFAACAASAFAQNVKVTPLGSHTGELCSRDRATLFEDPTGVRILYDAGHSVTGGDDPRLGAVHVVLLSHAHGDHIGDQKLKSLNGGTCDSPEMVSAAPASTTAEVAAAKNSALVMMGPMANFVGRKVENIRGKPTGNCPQTGDDLVAPFAAPCLAGGNIGGARTVRTADATRAVEITVVTAAHDSTVPRALLTDPERKNLDADNVSLTLGPSGGYVIRFTNGLARLPVRRHGAPRGDEIRRQRVPQGQPHGAEPRAERRDVACGRLRGERARAACLGDRVARQRGGDERRQGASRVAHRRVHGAGEGASRAPRAVRADDGVRRRGQVRERLLTHAAGEGAGRLRR